jgi:hypothetical protein
MGRLYTWLGVLGVCMFCGIIMIGIALGSIFPKVNGVAGPIVCGSQREEISRYTASYTPGSVDTVTTVYCIDPATGKKRDVSFLISLASGAVYGLAIFVLVAVIAGLRAIFGRKTASAT